MELTTQSPEGIDNAFLFKNALIEWLTEAYENWNLPNFFVSTQNLLEYESNVNTKELIKELNKIKYTPNAGMIEAINFTLHKSKYSDNYGTYSNNCGLKKYGPYNHQNNDDLVPLVTQLNTLKNRSDFPIFNNEERLITQSISVMFLAEIYNDVLSDIQGFFIKDRILKKEWTPHDELIYKDVITKLSQVNEEIDKVLLSKVIQLKRIVRMVQLQLTCADDEVFEEILRFPVGIFKDYMEKCWKDIPGLPIKRTDFEKLGNYGKQPSDENFITDVDVLSNAVKIPMNKAIQEINESNEAKEVNQFFGKVTTLLKNLIIEKELIQLVVQAEELLGKFQSMFVTDLFHQQIYTKLNESARQCKIADTLFEIWCTQTEFFMDILQSDNEQRQAIKEETTDKFTINLERYVKFVSSNNFSFTFLFFKKLHMAKKIKLFLNDKIDSIQFKKRESLFFFFINIQLYFVDC